MHPFLKLVASRLNPSSRPKGKFKVGVLIQELRWERAEAEEMLRFALDFFADGAYSGYVSESGDKEVPYPILVDALGMWLDRPIGVNSEGHPEPTEDSLEAQHTRAKSRLEELHSFFSSQADHVKTLIECSKPRTSKSPSVRVPQKEGAGNEEDQEGFDFTAFARGSKVDDGGEDNHSSTDTSKTDEKPRMSFQCGRPVPTPTPTKQVEFPKPAVLDMYSPKVFFDLQYWPFILEHVPAGELIGALQVFLAKTQARFPREVKSVFECWKNTILAVQAIVQFRNQDDAICQEAVYFNMKAAAALFPRIESLYLQAEHNATRESAERKELSEDLPSHVAAHVKEITVQKQKGGRGKEGSAEGRSTSKGRKPKPKAKGSAPLSDTTAGN